MATWDQHNERKNTSDNEITAVHPYMQKDTDDEQDEPIDLNESELAVFCENMDRKLKDSEASNNNANQLWDEFDRRQQAKKNTNLHEANLSPTSYNLVIAAQNTTAGKKRIPRVSIDGKRNNRTSEMMAAAASFNPKRKKPISFRNHPSKVMRIDAVQDTDDEMPELEKQSPVKFGKPQKARLPSATKLIWLTDDKSTRPIMEHSYKSDIYTKKTERKLRGNDWEVDDNPCKGCRVGNGCEWLGKTGKQMKKLVQPYFDINLRTNKQKRFHSYKAYIKLTYGQVGHVRLPIPCCVVQGIRNEFPSQGESYSTFQPNRTEEDIDNMSIQDDFEL